jgi:hypothetical protein
MVPGLRSKKTRQKKGVSNHFPVELLDVLTAAFGSALF